MIILGIETSCDETAAAVVENGTKILSNVVASSVKLHQKTGGIIPEVAAREQVKCIIPVIEEAISRAASEKGLGASLPSLTPNRYPLTPAIDALAVTYGPGLIGSLLVGVETAKTLSFVWQKPIVPVNHLVAHIYANWLEENNIQHTTYNKAPEFPALALVVSGGHTDLVLMFDHGKIRWLGGTRDDAAGECFDKGARLLGLGYPGGPAIAAAATKFRISSFQSPVKLPRPMINEGNFDFSFSGLKTAVLREVNNLQSNQPSFAKAMERQAIYQLSHEFQEAITDVLVAKTLRAAEKFKVKSILLAGGVSANQRLREKIQLEIGNCLPAGKAGKLEIKLFIPPPSLCTDNAAIIASCAYFNYHPLLWKQITAQPGLTITGEV